MNDNTVRWKGNKGWLNFKMSLILWKDTFGQVNVINTIIACILIDLLDSACWLSD